MIPFLYFALPVDVVYMFMFCVSWCFLFCWSNHNATNWIDFIWFYFFQTIFLNNNKNSDFLFVRAEYKLILFFSQIYNTIVSFISVKMKEQKEQKEKRMLAFIPWNSMIFKGKRMERGARHKANIELIFFFVISIECLFGYNHLK